MGQIAPTFPSQMTNKVQIRGERPSIEPDWVAFADENKLLTD